MSGMLMFVSSQKQSGLSRFGELKQYRAGDNACWTMSGHLGCCMCLADAFAIELPLNRMSAIGCCLIGERCMTGLMGRNCAISAV